ncbi:MAG: serine/threonine protein kinase [Deltaproteobacteria bacterium]|nr:serine/threonine protein kinase [Deltaproteobacteria bacterium]
MADDPRRALDATDPAVQGPTPTLPVAPTSGPHEVPGEPSVAPDALVGRILAGRYQLERVLGRGGMGIVYEARHLTVGRSVAVKVLRPELCKNAEATARFHREAQAAAAIGNEHIVEVFDFGYTAEGDTYLAMEKLDGQDLGRLLREGGALPEGRAVGIARQIASALAAAHAKGIVHRDLKSENVCILSREGRDFVKVLDFGISKVCEAEGSGADGPITHQGAVLGTPHYMAPEQGQGAADADHRVDLYALGCILYEMLTGRLPYTGRSVLEVLYRHARDPIPLPSATRPEVAATLDQVVKRCMAKDRAHRFASADELLDALPDATLLAGGEKVYVTAPPNRPRKPTQTRRWGQRLLLASMVAVGGLVTELAWRRNPPVQRAPRASAPPPPTRDAGATLAQQAPPPPPPPPPLDAGRPETVVLTLAVRPDNATLTVDGEAVSSGLWTGRLDRGHTVHLTASAPGWQPREAWVLMRHDQTLRWTLTRSPGVRAQRARDAGSTTAPIDGLKQSPYSRPGASTR